MSDNQIGRLDPNAAWDKLQHPNGAVLIDVRSKVEFDFVGHPPGALHIPWSEAPDWQPDPEFANQVRIRLQEHGAEDTIALLLLCRSGKRSQAAAQVLVAAGFKDIYNIDEGFEGDKDDAGHRSTVNGWRFHNLPWEQT